MSKRKVVKKRSSGCCWKKLLGKAFQKRDGNEISPNIQQQDEIIYLNLYLTSLEKKMQAIEEVTRLQWYRKEMDPKSKAEGRTYIRSGFRYLTDGTCKPYIPTANHFLDGPYNKLLPAGQYAARTAALNKNNSDAIIKEIMSLGSNNFDYESRKWSTLTTPPTIAGQESIIGNITELDSSTGTAQYTFKKYQVAALSYPVEFYTSSRLGEAILEKPKVPVKASCSIHYFDTENKTIEIMYDNKEWDKRGTIVLKDIENQAGVQAELIGRVVCFLLGMGEVDLV
ncbi:hypothetical protein GE061_014561 [Apolygus lucorum]|uniref:Uncharacterized protein n=1 Tax=Apolygus lucorum TaxID=248454 RepID=A0A8S9XID5_APOLU|nr:hypothetical protein GE061_014561 [Apolygus lucorum]